MNAASSIPYRSFLALILAGARHDAELEARRLSMAHGVTYLYEQVVLPSLIEVGALWEANEITVADEHLATATAEAAVAALYPSFPWKSGGPKVIVGTLEGNEHQFGAHMVADLLALDGWDDLFLGAGVPIGALAKKVAQIRPRLVAISASMAAQLSTLHASVKAIRDVAPATKIMAGGRAVSSHREQVLRFGVDAVADRGSNAVEIARAWR